MTKEFEDITFELSQDHFRRPDPENAPDEWDVYWRASAIPPDKWIDVAQSIIENDDQLRVPGLRFGPPLMCAASRGEFIGLRCAKSEIKLWDRRVQELVPEANKGYRQSLVNKAQREAEEEQAREQLMNELRSDE